MAANSQRAGKKRGPGRPFQKGQSGNPRGRKPDAELKAARELCAPYAQEAVDAIIAIIRRGRSEMARIVAAEKILERVYGRVPQKHSGDEESPIRVQIEGLRDAIARRLAERK